MKKTTKNILIGAGLLGVSYLVYRAIKAVNTPAIIPAPTVDTDAEVIETNVNPRSKTPKAYTTRPHLDPLKDFPMKFGSKGYEVGLLQEHSTALNASWNFAQQNNRPWVIWKTATTLDGFVAAEDGTSKWITGEPARERVQEIRASVGAILTGTGTVLADDPLLTVRSLPADKQPLRVIVGDRDLPADSQIFTGEKPAIRMAGDLSKVISELWQSHGVHSVLVEAGSHVSQSLWSANLVDEVYWFQAPVILGSGKPAIGNFGVNTLANASRFPEYQVDRVGLDLLVHFTTR